MATAIESDADPMGAWLQDHEEYLDGQISHAELQRRNCERYRSSPPICGSAKLTDSEQNRRAVRREEQDAQAAAELEQNRRYLCARRTAIVWVIIALMGLALFTACLVIHEWLVAAVIVQPLAGAVFDALKSVYEWRRFDE